jgi:hypothetical protein
MSRIASQTNGERPGLTRIGTDRCARLRWKGLYIEAQWDPTVQHGNDRIFWCTHTYNCLGPDSNVADENECSPARACYEPL